MTVPTRKKWNELKKQHKVPDGAVKGVNLGEALDKVDKATTPDTINKTLADFAKVANTYITKLDKKKITDFPKFQKTFLDDYLGAATKHLNNVKLEQDGKALYASELRKFLQAVQKLDPQKSETQDLQRFVQFARGLSSVAKRIGGAVDTTEIDRQLGRIHDLNDNMSYNTATRADIAQFVGDVVNIAKRIAAVAKAHKLTG